jgi:hypothetical protein
MGYHHHDGGAGPRAARGPTLPGDLFPHAVRWCGELFLENGLHRALRAALQQRTALHVWILDLDLLRR